MITKEQLLEEITLDDVKTILIELGSQHIETHLDKDELITNTICHNVSDGNMKLYYYIDSKFFHCYTKCACNYSIFDLVIKNHAIKNVNMDFSDAFRWVLRVLGKSDSTSKPNGFEHNTTHRLDELDWLDNLIVDRPVIVPIKEHSEYMFELFSKEPHPAFLKDGISKEAMKKFEICYYEKTNRIVIPHRHWKTGGLIGFKTRSLDFKDIDNGYKYIPLRLGENDSNVYSYPTFQNLFAFYQNRENIMRRGKLLLFESEKSVLQCETYFPNNNFSSALCGTNLSKIQCEIICSNSVDEVILCLDKEYVKINSKEFEKQKEKEERICNLLSQYVTMSVVRDTKGLINLKDSPSDHGKDVLLELIKQRKIISTRE